MLSGDDDQSRSRAREGFERFYAEQGSLARYLSDRLSLSLDESALALGQMLADAVAAADAALGADEELRRSDPMDALDSEDIVAIEQPALVAFVNEHIGLTLEKHAGSIDVDHVAVVFRAILVEILALSHAVLPPPGYPAAQAEPMA
jgi:hypothetical protein